MARRIVMFTNRSKIDKMMQEEVDLLGGSLELYDKVDHKLKDIRPVYDLVLHWKQVKLFCWRLEMLREFVQDEQRIGFTYVASQCFDNIFYHLSKSTSIKIKNK